MFSASNTRALKSRRVARRAVQASMAAAVVGLAMAAPGYADTSFFYDGPATGVWDVGSFWNSPTSGSPLTTWVNAATSDALINQIGAGGMTLTLNSGVTANHVTVAPTASLTIGATGATQVLTLNTLTSQVSAATINIYDPLSSPGQLVIQGAPSTTTNKNGISLFANTNDLNGGIDLTGGSTYLNLGNNALPYYISNSGGTLPAQFATPAGSSLAGTAGAVVQSGQILLTSVSATTSNPSDITSFPAITMDGWGSEITLGKINANDYELPNAVILNQANPSQAATFYVALGAGNVAGTGVNFGTGPFPNTALIDFAGKISGNGNVIISNDFYGGGGRGNTEFSNSGNNYTGKTVLNLNGQYWLRFIMGNTTVIPVTSDVVFGAASLASLPGVSAINSKQVGALDLNGYDVTVKSLSSDLGTNFTLGITNLNNHAIDANLPVGPHSAVGSVSTLTIDSQGAANNTFYAGNIWDGSDYLAQSGSATSQYVGQYTSAGAQAFFAPASGLKVALTLAATNTGALTLGAASGAKTPVYSYSGGTNINGGSLYVNGNLTAASGSVATQVNVNTPTGSNVAVLGGTGTITPDIHVYPSATLAPGSSPTAYTGVNLPSAYTTAPTSFTAGTFTAHNLTMDGASQLNFLINNGTSAAVAGTDYGILAFSAAGSFTEGASVTALNPIYVHPLGTFNGFVNYHSVTWNLATFPAGTALSNLVMDTRNGYSPLPVALLSGGTFTLNGNGTAALSLVFTPSANVKAVQYSGPAAAAWNSDTSNKVWTDLVGNIVGGPITSYGDPYNVVFATPAASTVITVDPVNNVAPASVVFNNAGAAVSYTLQGGSITGGCYLLLNGSGHVILAAANTYSGGTGVNGGGTLETQISGALGSGDLALTNGTWALTTADQSHTLNVQVTGSSLSSTTSTIQTGPLSGPSGPGIGNLALTGNISGSGTLTKTGVGALTINGNLSQGGDLNVNGGNVVINGNVAYAGTTRVVAGAGIEYKTPTNATIGFTVSANLAGTLTFDNETDVTFNPGTYPTGGTIILNAGESKIQGSGAAPGGAPPDIGNTIVLNPSNINASNFNVYVGQAGKGTNFSLHGPITGNGNVYFSASGPTQSDGATINLYGQNTYTGATYLNNDNVAPVVLQVDNALPVGTQLIFGEGGQGAGAFDLNGHNQTLAGLSTDPAGGGFEGLEDTAGGASLTVNGSTNATFNALISSSFLTLNVAMQNAYEELSYNGSNKDTNGTILSYGNIYGGVTNVTSGALRISNPLALSPFQTLVLQGGVLEVHAHGFMMASGNVYGLPVNPTGAFTNSLGSSPNLVNWVPGTAPIQVLSGNSGFSAYGSQPGIINLGGNPTTTVWGGSGGTIVWGSAFFTPTVLVLNQTTAEQPLDFQNGLDLNAADRTVAVNSTLAGTPATISGVISNSSANAGLVKNGPGTLILTAANTYNGTTTLNAGTLLVNNTTGSGTGTGDVKMNGGTLGGSGTISGVVHDPIALSWKIHPSETLSSTSATTLHVGGLTTSSAATLDFNLVTPGAAGSSDLIQVNNNNGLIVNDGIVAFTNHSTGPGSLGYYKIIAYSGSIQGAGLGSLTLPADDPVTHVAYRLYTTVDKGFVDVHRGLLGDANDDGLVNFSDFVTLSNNFGQTNAGWGGGDFNNDGITNFSDFVILSNNFGATIGANEVASFSSPATSGVPEPASLMLLGAPAAGLLLRRRRV